MKTIEPFNNTATIIHVTELPPLNDLYFAFGFNPGKFGAIPILRVNVKLMANVPHKEPIKIATYDSSYKISGEGLVLEDHIHICCQQAIYAMKTLLPRNEIGRSIPEEIFRCPGKEAFEDDLIHLAKALNSIDGKRGWPVKK